ncbi:hypothetical protein RUND412_008629 [Rhizina undulata]
MRGVDNITRVEVTVTPRLGEWPDCGADMLLEATAEYSLGYVPRAGALVRDTIYLDSGDIQYTRIMSSGNNVVASELARQYTYMINLTQPFDTLKDNVSLVMSTIDKYGASEMPNMQNGHMLANNYEFVLYGGYALATSTIPQQPADWAYARYIYQQGDVNLNVDWNKLTLENVTRYIADGAYSNVPSENLAFVFGGVRGQNWGEIDSNNLPTIASSELITANMSVSKSETFTNVTTSIPARTGGELPWIPVGENGVLVAIGGMDYISALTNYTVDEMAAIRARGQSYMETVEIFDIASGTWYSQETTGDIPPANTEFCSVVASPSDGSTHEIFIYGGWSGPPTLANLTNTVNDDVYTLSIPSMVWTKVYSGNANTHGRREHRCHRVADNLMMVIGGRALTDTGTQSCPDGLIQVFNLNTLEWVEVYDPALNAAYQVNSVVTNSIQNAQKSTYNSTALLDVLDTTYNKTIPQYWPFKTVQNPNLNTTGSSNGSTPSVVSAVGSGLPSYIPPLLGSIFGLLVVIIILCGVLIWLRRRRVQAKRAQSDSAATTVRKNRQTWSWLLGVYGDEARDYDQSSCIDRTNPMEEIDEHGIMTPRNEVQQNPIEAEGMQVFEMPDTSIPHELPSPPVAARKVNFEDIPTEVKTEPKPAPE